MIQIKVIDKYTALRMFCALIFLSATSFNSKSRPIALYLLIFKYNILLLQKVIKSWIYQYLNRYSYLFQDEILQHYSEDAEKYNGPIKELHDIREVGVSNIVMAFSRTILCRFYFVLTFWEIKIIEIELFWTI